MQYTNCNKCIENCIYIMKKRLNDVIKIKEIKLCLKFFFFYNSSNIMIIFLFSIFSNFFVNIFVKICWCFKKNCWYFRSYLIASFISSNSFSFFSLFYLSLFLYYLSFDKIFRLFLSWVVKILIYLLLVFLYL